MEGNGKLVVIEYCVLDSKSNDRVKVGKAILSYNPENRRIYATVAANITLGEKFCRLYTYDNHIFTCTSE
jgi:hypothetical protein